MTRTYHNKMLFIDERYKKHIIPKDVETIYIYKCYNCEYNKKKFIQKNINKKLSKLTKLKNLILDNCCFNYKIDNLPQSLTLITFGYDFNQKVDKLPKNLFYLTFGDDFNQKIDKLPKNITQITFGFLFNQKIDKLPKNLTHITFYSIKNNQTIDIDKLSKQLEYINLGRYEKEVYLPKNIKELTLKFNNNLINNLPEHIEKLNIIFDNDIRIIIIKYKNFFIANIPSTIKEIVIENKEYKKYLKIPFGCILTIEKINY
jgi:hypothetical protein